MKKKKVIPCASYLNVDIKKKGVFLKKIEVNQVYIVEPI